MTVVVRRRCGRCGALWEGGHGGAWIRCASCTALVDFDWQGFFEGDDYRRFLANSSASMERWKVYAARLAAGQQLARAGQEREALVAFRGVSELLLELLPYVAPPEAQQPGAYRDAVVTWQAWWQLQLATHAPTVALQAEIEKSQRGLDLRNPLPTVLASVELMRKQLARFADSDAPPDPDGLDPVTRVRVTTGMFVGAFLPMLGPEQRLAVVKELYGANNVAVRGDVTEDDAGLYFDWTCVLCGLTSLQGRGTTELCCLGCYFRRPFRIDDLPLPAVRTKCVGCGADIDVPKGALQAACAYCHTVSTRLSRTGTVEREFAHAIAVQYGGGALPEGGVAGFPVTDANRLDLVLTGLARTAMYFGTLVSAERYVRIVRPSFAHVNVAVPVGLAGVRERVQREGGPRTAYELLDACAAILERA